MCIRDAINIQGHPEPYLKTICLPHLVTFVSESKQSLVSGFIRTLEVCLNVTLIYIMLLMTLVLCLLWLQHLQRIYVRVIQHVCKYMLIL